MTWDKKQYKKAIETVVDPNTFREQVRAELMAEYVVCHCGREFDCASGPCPQCGEVRWIPLKGGSR